jgi:alcohol dehydrogenase (cytochrome c)
VEKEHNHGFYFGGEMAFDKWEEAKGWLTAFDASTGKQKWRYAAAKPIIGAVAVTAGNLVLTGELTGDFIALDAASGKVLFRVGVGGPIAGGVITYTARDAQNVAVVSGFVGMYNAIAPAVGGGNTTVTVFRVTE